MSNEATYLGLHLRLFDDLVALHPEYVMNECLQDKRTVTSRVRTEGIAFVTKTLPTLAKHLESALETGTFVPHPSFKSGRGKTYPKFLGALFKEIFDAEGRILDNPSWCCIRSIRQVCYFLYKLESDFTDDLVNKAINDFVETDRTLTHCESLGRQERLLLTIASSFLFRVFRDFDPRDIKPRSGPGASASGTHKSQRYEPLTKFDVLHEKYPYYRYFYMSSLHLADRRTAYLNLPRKTAGQSLMRLVPKDSRGPRIICMEEQEYMFLQQGLGDAIRDHLESHPLTRGHVNFRSQEVNQRLALESSISGQFATLDMKEASDRISKKLVALLFDKLPDLRDCLLALSTPEIRLPTGEVIRVNKFAPMGSSLCFPVMSIVHYALGVAAMHVHTGDKTSALAKRLYVYGDDIIVDTRYTNYLFESFPLFGLMFNQGKSFYRGSFRESCGVDAFQGWNVTPQRIKKRFFDHQDPRSLSAALDVYAHLYEKGWLRTAKMLRTVLEARFGGFPSVVRGSPFLGFVDNQQVPEDVFHILKDSTRQKSDVIFRFISASDRAAFDMLDPVWDADIQQMTVKARVMETEPDASMAGGWEQLMRSNLESSRSSARLDGRWKRQVVRYQRMPYHCIESAGSTWLPNQR